MQGRFVSSPAKRRLVVLAAVVGAGLVSTAVVTPGNTSAVNVATSTTNPSAPTTLPPRTTVPRTTVPKTTLPPTTQRPTTVPTTKPQPTTTKPTTPRTTKPPRTTKATTRTTRRASGSTTDPFPRRFDPRTFPVNPGLDDGQCAYRADLLVGGPEVQQFFTPLREPNRAIPGLTAEDLAALQKQGLYLYLPGRDPLAVSRSLRDQGVESWPVLLVAGTRHWIFGSGTGAVDMGKPFTGPKLVKQPSTVIAEIDSGFTPSPTADAWLSGRVVSAEVEPAGLSPEGHGKFVASVIAQQNPDASLVVAAMSPTPGSEFVNATGLSSITISDELQLYSAMRRLLATDHAKDFSVLNLSVGSYGCGGEWSKGQGMLIAAALGLWYDATGDKPIVAAVGNHDPALDPTYDPTQIEFLPGQWGTGDKADIPFIGQHPLYGVQSVDAFGKRSTFSNAGAFSAPGEMLCGVRLDGLTSIWSGSSFATAIASGAVAAGRIPDASSPVTQAAGNVQWAPDGRRCTTGVSAGPST